ncbi:MAG TPA: N-acetyltransferase [Pyrinomonadaceae bacterium]|jgi:ribosomal protein S18 acetylase RimI-like enzyme
MEQNWPEQLTDVNFAVTLRRATPEDEDFLFKVYSSTRAAEMAMVPWNDAQKHAFLQMQHKAQRQSYDEKYPAADYNIVFLDERPVGRLWVVRTDDAIHLLDIAILTEHQNSGIGTYLLHQLIAEADASGKTMRHTVYKDNTGAQRFYERLGFASTGEVGMYLFMERKSPTVNATPPTD